MDLTQFDIPQIYFDSGYYRKIDRHFANFICTLEGHKSYELYLAALTVSRYSGIGSICVDLNEEIIGDVPEDIDEKIQLPDLDSWLLKLKEKKVVGDKEKYAPLILDGTRLYLQRYWQYENNVVQKLVELSENRIKKLDTNLLKSGLDILFQSNQDETDWQRLAAENSVLQHLSIITGGPGTGKTTTVVKILLLILEQAIINNSICRIALCAPTGKAAAHLSRSIHNTLSTMRNQNFESLKRFNKYLDLIPEQAFTVHRLLKSIHGTPYFKYNHDNLLPYDLIVVDETSMIDVALMSKLLDALSKKVRIILLGDKDQLSSVEAGSLLGDICSSKKSVINHCVAELKKSYRFGEKSGIGNLSREVNSGNGNEAFKIVLNENKKWEDLSFLKLPQISNQSDYLDFKNNIKEIILSKEHGYDYKNVLKNSNVSEMFKALKNFQILCAVRKGKFGVENLNNLIEEILIEKGLINKKGLWYHGLPIIISKNDYSLQLYNGDIGIVVEENNKLFVYFEEEQVGKNKHPYKRINPLQIKSYEPVYAMTVHKSQGSEFKNVLLVLPDKKSIILTRELLYTGITRAREKFQVMAEKKIFINACKKKIYRMSGLHDKISK